MFKISRSNSLTAAAGLAAVALAAASAAEAKPLMGSSSWNVGERSVSKSDHEAVSLLDRFFILIGFDEKLPDEARLRSMDLSFAGADSAENERCVKRNDARTRDEGGDQGRDALSPEPMLLAF